MQAPRWDSDGEPGGPSSLDVLVQWLIAPGNVEHWRVRDQPVKTTVDAIYAELARHGFAYRSRGAIHYKVWTLMQQMKAAQSYITRCRVKDFNTNANMRRKVLRICPVYDKLATALLRAPSLAYDDARGVVVKLEDNGSDTSGDPVDAFSEGQWSAVESGSSLSEPESMRTPTNYCGGKKSKKRKRRHGDANTEAFERVALLEATDGELREYFQLQVQAKRDEAICVRANARKELLDLGIPRKDVDRLLPL